MKANVIFVLLERSIELSDLERDELMNNIDFSEINEETIRSCRRDRSIGQKLLRDGALSLCSQLRLQLEESRSQLKRVEFELRKYLRSSPSNTSSEIFKQKQKSSKSARCFSFLVFFFEVIDRVV